MRVRCGPAEGEAGAGVCGAAARRLSLPDHAAAQRNPALATTNRTRLDIPFIRTRHTILVRSPAVAADLYDAAQLANVDHEAPKARREKQLRIAPPRVELLGHSRLEYLFATLSLPHQLGHLVADFFEHVELRLQIDATLQRSDAGHDHRLGVGEVEQRLGRVHHPAEPPTGGIVR